MQPLLLVLLALALTAVSCGGKDKGSSSSGVFSSSLSTQEGFLNPYSQNPIEVGGTSYPVSSQQNDMLIRQALQQAQMQGIQPVSVNGQMKYRARFTGSIYNPYANNNGAYGGTYYPGQMPPTTNQNVLQLTSVQFY